MNRKLIFIIVASVAAAVVVYWLVSPLFITRRVNEPIHQISGLGAGWPDDTFGIVSIREGSFVGQEFHEGMGTVALLKINNRYFIRFEDDFRVTNGPDLFVYFGKNGQYAAQARIAALKGNVGSQNYEVPAEIDVEAYDEVWVWCRAFSVPFARAVLK